MDSNHRTRKRADLQSAAVGHLATYPLLQIIHYYISNLQNLSHLPESNWRPTDYKSVALPTELRWHKLFQTTTHLNFSISDLPDF